MVAAEYEHTEAFRGASFTDADLPGAKFRDCDMARSRSSTRGSAT
jgi:uncharacterized protein YjbI with pentapeptide repeats